MPKVMRDPSRQQLPQPHGTELGMVAFESELCVRKAPFGKRFETLSKQRSELVDELREQLALATDRAVPPRYPGRIDRTTSTPQCPPYRPPARHPRRPCGTLPMTMSVHEPAAFAELLRTRLVAVIRATTPAAALAAAHAVADGGISLIEITYSVPEAPRVMQELSSRSDIVMGAGTVLTRDQARMALDAGAQFIIAPNFSLEVAQEALAAGVMYCPAAYTTTEIITARNAGAHVLKIYPVGIAGGPAYIQVIRDPLPDIPMLAAGGTNLDNVLPFLAAGCIGVGLGASLADPKLALAGDTTEITRRARAFAARVAGLPASAAAGA